MRFNVLSQACVFLSKTEILASAVSHNKARTKYIRRYIKLIFLFASFAVIVTCLVIFSRPKEKPQNNIKQAAMCFPFLSSQQNFSTETNQTPRLQLGQYYSNWSPYEPYNFFPRDIDMTHTTHIYYSFISIDKKTGSVYLQDEHADTSMKTASRKDRGLILEFNHMRRNNDYFKHKVSTDNNILISKVHSYNNTIQNQKNFRLVMSIGGWSEKENFAVLAKKPKFLDNFISSAVELVMANGFDGIDIDWEYPQSKAEIATYVEIFKRLRCEFNKLEQQIFKTSTGSKWFHLSTAVPCNKDILKTLQLKSIEALVDNFNLMAYDLSGEWSKKTGYHSNLFSSSQHGTGENVDSVVRYAIDTLKLSPQKIILGIPLYGRSFKNVVPENGSVIGASFKGVDDEFDRDSPGVWPYYAIADLKYTTHYDQNMVAAYAYDLNKKHLIVYDDVNCIKRKAGYIEKMHLGGGFFWEAHGEKVKKLDERVLNYFSENVSRALDKSIESVWNTDEMLRYFQTRKVKNHVELLAKQSQKVLAIMQMPRDG